MYIFSEYNVHLTRIFITLSNLIHKLLSIQFVLMGYLLICLAVIIFFLIRKHTIYYRLYSVIYDLFFKLGLLLFFHILIYTTVKIIVAKPRPYIQEGIHLSGICFDDLSSFPSSHFGLALLILIFFYRNSVLYYLLCLSIMSIVGFSRIILHKHYIIDCVGSILITPVMYMVCIFLMKKFNKINTYFRYIFYVFYKKIHNKLH